MDRKGLLIACGVLVAVVLFVWVFMPKGGGSFGGGGSSGPPGKVYTEDDVRQIRQMERTEARHDNAMQQQYGK